MSETKTKPAGEPETAEDKTYEVVHSIAIGQGGKTVTRNRGEEVRQSELAPGEAERFLAAGILIDPETAITIASSNLAHDRLLSIATKLGLVTHKGSEYSFGGKKIRGLSEFRKAISLDELEAAIVAAAAK